MVLNTETVKPVGFGPLAGSVDGQTTLSLNP